MDLSITPLDANTFRLTGDSTIFYTNQLKSLGGIYDTNYRYGPAWIFDNVRLKDLTKFINDLQNNQLVPSDILEYNASAISSGYAVPVNINLAPLPIITSGINNSSLPISIGDYQVVTYNVFKPDKGMIVNINLNGQSSQYRIIDIENDQGIIDGVYIEPINNNGPISKLVIINGRWQVLGLIAPHEVRFDRF